MLKQLTLSNFRVFDDEVTIRFRPITVLIGKNNSGKSSIIKFLLMLQQSLGDDARQFINPWGNQVELGDFPSLKNSTTTKNELHFSLDTEQIETDDILVNQLITKRNQSSSERIIYSMNATVPYKDNSQQGETNCILMNSSSDVHLKCSQTIEGDSLLLRFGKYIDKEFDKEFGKVIASGSPPDVLRKNIAAARNKSNIVRKLINTLRREINSLRHLSPVRQEFQRVISFSHPPKGDVGQYGQYTMSHLMRIQSKDKDLYDFLCPHIEAVTGVENISFSPLTKTKNVAECLAKNKETGAKAQLADFGFGVSQCLPVLIQGSMMNPYTSLMIEQPEAQVHPTAQLELGSFFADLWNKKKVGSIIETHSGNILLRLRRLIANNTISPEDVSVVFCDSKDGKATVKNLTIEKDGTMKDGLPMEFFHADIWEALELGAGK